MNPTAMVVDVQFACRDTGLPSETDIQEMVEFAASQSGRMPDGDADVAVRVVDAAEIQALNKRYRDKDVPTNVLSFPAGQIEGLPGDAVRQLGDIVVCAPVVGEEAAQQGKSLGDHWAHMLVHGVLHLLGYDHENSADADEMERLEAAILNDRGIANPYAGTQVR
jgi:probable rRNA maturation factor